jgi:putative thiamine transport system permease protein
MMRYGLMALILIPIITGLIGAILPALGYLPPLGGVGFSLDPALAFAALPGIDRSIALSLFSGILATAISTSLALILPGLLYGRPGFRMLGRYLSPILSLPHITVAVGVLFLMQPSGWLMRLISPHLTGYERPPVDYLFPDQAGLTLVLGMVAKEIPFLILMTLSALSQINTRPLLTVARTMGYGPMAAWLYIIVPALWVRLKLPVLIVLVFSLSVVDMAVVLAPTTPPPLAVRVVTLYQDPDLAQRFVASVAAMAQMLIVVIGAMIFFGGTKLLGRVMMVAVRGGWRLNRWPSLIVQCSKAGLLITGLLPMTLAMVGLFAAMIWSVAGRWRFPSAWPETLSFRYWAGAIDGFATIVQTTLILGFISSFLGLIMVMSWLWVMPSSDQRSRNKNHWSEQLLFLPLVLPQTGFLFGIQIMLLWLRLDGSIIALIWVHMLFVVPYIWLALAPSWRSFNRSWLNLAGSLGASPLTRFFRVRLPIMIQPILVSFAIGFSVSAALYLPTIFAGNGQVVTLTVEAVTLASGASRSQLGVATGFQMALPLMIYIMAGIIAGIRTRRFSYFA